MLQWQHSNMGALQTALVGIDRTLPSLVGPRDAPRALRAIETRATSLAVKSANIREPDQRSSRTRAQARGFRIKASAVRFEGDIEARSRR